MIIKELSVRNFRNIASSDFSFDSKVNIFTGNNAQGKTNLCEAISVCLGKSFRSPKVSELLPFSDRDKEIAIEMSFFFDNMKEKENVITYVQKNHSARLKFNGIEMKSAEDFINDDPVEHSGLYRTGAVIECVYYDSSLCKRFVLEKES